MCKIDCGVPFANSQVYNLLRDKFAVLLSFFRIYSRKRLIRVRRKFSLTEMNRNLGCIARFKEPINVVVKSCETFCISVCMLVSLYVYIYCYCLAFILGFYVSICRNFGSQRDYYKIIKKRASHSFLLKVIILREIISHINTIESICLHKVFKKHTSHYIVLRTPQRKAYVYVHALCHLDYP